MQPSCCSCRHAGGTHVAQKNDRIGGECVSHETPVKSPTCGPRDSHGGANTYLARPAEACRPRSSAVAAPSTIATRDRAECQPGRRSITSGWSETRSQCADRRESGGSRSSAFRVSRAVSTSGVPGLALVADPVRSHDGRRDPATVDLIPTERAATCTSSCPSRQIWVHRHVHTRPSFEIALFDRGDECAWALITPVRCSGDRQVASTLSVSELVVALGSASQGACEMRCALECTWQ